MLADKAPSNADCLSWPRSYTTRRYWPTPHHLATGNPVPSYGKYRIAHPRIEVSLCCIGHSMSSSLEDRIRLLTDRAIAAKTQRELDAILPELKAAITDHIRYVRAIVVETIPEAFGTQSKTAA
jgi:hypothetical protein